MNSANSTLNFGHSHGIIEVRKLAALVPAARSERSNLNATAPDSGEVGTHRRSPSRHSAQTTSGLQMPAL